MRKILLYLCILFFSISTCWSLPAPAYLTVNQWKRCVHTVTKGTAQFVCLPAKKPFHCPSSSWRKLNDGQLMQTCAAFLSQ